MQQHNDYRTRRQESGDNNMFTFTFSLVNMKCQRQRAAKLLEPCSQVQEEEKVLKLSKPMTLHYANMRTV